MGWLFDKKHNSWHLWPQASPEPGDRAWCGHVKDENSTPSGGTDVYQKCQGCVKNKSMGNL